MTWIWAFTINTVANLIIEREYIRGNWSDDTKVQRFLFFSHHFGSQNIREKLTHLHGFRGLTMVHTCVVTGCRNRRTLGTSLSFYRFPRDPERKQRWIAAVNREGWVPNDGSRLCSNHFISGMQSNLLKPSVSMEDRILWFHLIYSFLFKHNIIT